MQGDVMVSFGPEDSRQWHVPAAPDSQEARAWLDAQYLALECEPLRASGKVLTADKLLAIADAAGRERFDDPDWGARFAACAVGSTQRPMLRIDLAQRAVHF